MTTLLLIEDDPIVGESLVQRFELEGFQTHWCRRLAEAAVCMDQSWSAVVSDVRLPDGLATHWFSQQSAAVRAVPWFFLTGYGSANDAIAAIRAGAREYLTKPFDTEQLVVMLRAALNTTVEQDQTAVLGISPAMRKIEALVHKVAGQPVSVLLTGESGVGKEVVAQLIHQHDESARLGDFVAVNCAAVPDTMAESEFFGYEKGAFTGAVKAHKGFLERAHNGTLFLDEVGELSAAMQAKLLRALQERCFFRLGSEKTTHSKFRVIAATNRDLYAEMAAGRFREDLFYRLAVIRIGLPPLRERVEDIRWLTHRLLAQISSEQKRPLAFSEAFIRDVMTRTWKGNIRELRSYLEESVIFSEAGILDIADPTPEQVSMPIDLAVTSESLRDVMAQTEIKHIKRVLLQNNGSISKTSATLGISRKTLWEKMKRFNIEIEDKLLPMLDEI